LFPDKAKDIPIPKNKKRGRKTKTTKARNHQNDIGNQFARLSKSDCEDHSDNTSDHLERILGKKRCRSVDETRNDIDEDALNENDNNYNANVTNFEEMAVQSIIDSSTTVAPSPSTTATAAADVDDDDDIIIEKYVGGKLGETVTVGSLFNRNYSIQIYKTNRLKRRIDKKTIKLQSTIK